MDADLMAFRHHAALLVRVEERRDGRNEEGRLGIVFGKRIQDPRHALAVAVLALGHAPDGFAAVAQFVRLVIRVEGQSNGAAGTVLPFRRLHGASCADVIHLAAPCLLVPRPGLAAQIVHGDIKSLSQIEFLRRNQERPPSAEMIWPEIQPAASDARNITAFAISCGCPRRRV